MNNIDIDLVLSRVDKLTRNKYITLNNLIKKVNTYSGLDEEKKRLNNILKTLVINKKAIFVIELFMASDFTLSSRAMEKYIKDLHEENEYIPLISKSAIDRYLRNEELIISIYGDNLYNKILSSRIEITENNRISKKVI